jgi:hypothetical protein
MSREKTREKEELMNQSKGAMAGNLGFVVKKIRVHEAQLRVIDKICRERQKPTGEAFLDAIQLYIGSYKIGAV